DAQNRVILTRVQADPPDPQVDSTSSMSYNSIGKVETSTDRLRRVTRYNYDARGNLVQTEYPGSDVNPVVPVTIARTVYDAAGRVYQTAERRLHPSGDPDLEEDRSVTTHAYDDAGRRIATSVALDDETGQLFDGRLVAQYFYDDAGNLTGVTDALHTETAPRVTEYEYDGMNRRVLT